MLPSTAAMVSTTQTNTKLYGITPVAVSRPTVKSKESPGSSANRPHSAKTMNATPHSAYGPKRLIRYSGSIQDGSSIGTNTAASRRVTSGNGTVADCEFPKTSKAGDPLNPRGARGAPNRARGAMRPLEGPSTSSGHIVNPARGRPNE